MVINLKKVVPSLRSLRWTVRLRLAPPSRFEETLIDESKRDVVWRENRLKCYTISVHILFTDYRAVWRLPRREVCLRVWRNVGRLRTPDQYMDFLPVIVLRSFNGGVP